MRLFVAIDVSTAVKDHLSFLQRSLELLPHVRWVHPKNLHLTLNFIGENYSPDEVIKQLNTISFISFTLKLSSLEFLPSLDQPRIMWVSLEQNTELSSLQKDIDTLFIPKKSFKPHLTLGRIRKNFDVHQLKMCSAEVQKLTVNPLSFKVTQFKLYRSTLTSVGPIYEVLETFKPR